MATRKPGETAAIPTETTAPEPPAATTEAAGSETLAAAPAPSPQAGTTPAGGITTGARRRKRSGSGSMSAADRLHPAARKHRVFNALLDSSTYVPIGSGAFADVGKIMHRTLKVEVAVKIFRDNMRETWADKIISEWALTQGIPSRVPVKALMPPHVDEEITFTIFEYVKGTTLKDAIAESNGPLGFERARNITLTLLEGLAAAHSVNVVHRDIKPENLIEPEPELGDVPVRILDYGLAKIVEASASNSMVGVTMRYTSPEQIQSRSGTLTTATDIYSAGIVAYELFTGMFPWDLPPDAALNEYVGCHLRKYGAPMSAIARMKGRFPPALDDLLMRMMEYEHARRPKAEEAIAVLRAIPSDPRAWVDFGDGSGETVRAAAIEPAATQRVAAIANTPEGSATTPTPARKSGRGLIVALVGLSAVAGVTVLGLRSRGAAPTTQETAPPKVAAAPAAVTTAPITPTIAPTPATQQRTLPPAAAVQHAAAPKTPFTIPGVEAWAVSGDVTIENVSGDAFVLLGATVNDGGTSYSWSGESKLATRDRRVLFHGAWKPSFPPNLHQGSTVFLRVRYKGQDGELPIAVQE